GVAHLLELFDSTITFRARYQGHEDLLALADLLVLDDTNPRAFAGVLRRLRTELSKLPGAGGVTGSAANGADEGGPTSLVARLPAAGVGITLEDLRDVDDVALASFLGDLARDLRERALSLAEEIGHRYFALADGPAQVQHT
ncbi:MAG TPA: alpha-E domain-containing protein, partial [Chromatiaceae bacterium]|nr:alpha-E domain-containing protein [Chromatiaceae bacterium]